MKKIVTAGTPTLSMTRARTISLTINLCQRYEAISKSHDL